MLLRNSLPSLAQRPKCAICLLFAPEAVKKRRRDRSAPTAVQFGASMPKIRMVLITDHHRWRQARLPWPGTPTVRGPSLMPEVIFTGAAGRIEGRYHPARQRNSPIGIVLHPHPQFGGTMNHQIIYQLYYAFAHRNFSVLRFNFRGVGRSQGSFDHGQGELSDAASALDWAQIDQPRGAQLLDRGLFLRRLDRHAALDATTRDRGIHLDLPRRPICTISRSSRPARHRASLFMATRMRWCRTRTSTCSSTSSRLRRAS